MPLIVTARGPWDLQRPFYAARPLCHIVCHGYLSTLHKQWHALLEDCKRPSLASHSIPSSFDLLPAVLCGVNWGKSSCEVTAQEGVVSAGRLRA
jgi:hypothetical protein